MGEYVFGCLYYRFDDDCADLVVFLFDEGVYFGEDFLGLVYLVLVFGEDVW